MKSLPALVLATSPLLAAALWSALPGQADSRSFEISQLPPLPAETSTKQTSSSELTSSSEQTFSSEWFWLRAAQPTKLAPLADQLGIPVRDLAKANQTLTSHTFRKGEWIRLPASASEGAIQISGLDSDTLTTSAPLTPPPPVSDKASIKSGDSLASFLNRHGLTSDQLKLYNPGLDLTRLSVGREVRVAKAAGGQKLLAIRPTVSGGASWPNLPSLPVKESFKSMGPTYIWPTKGVFTSGFGWRWGRMHKGIDIANNTGTSIHASRAGIVSYAGWSSGYGYLVEITHEDGESTRYAHNSQLLVKEGQIVSQGARISNMGSTGRSTGPHLHFEIRRRSGGAVNPLGKLPARA